MSSIAVAIASLGRPDSVRDVLQTLKNQSRPIDQIILSVTSEEDLPEGLDDPMVRVIMGSKGSSVQRNRVLDGLSEDIDYIVYFDDDYVPSRHSVERIVEFFEANPEIVGAMGDTIADGIGGPGYTFEQARDMVKSYDAKPRPTTKILRDVSGLYGCNMAFRTSAIGDTRFDENLPLYGWLEDNDFSNQLLAQGRLVHTNAFAGVHCGVKTARSPGLRLGYSQMVNPIYLSRKGTLPWAKAIKLMSQNIIANHLKTWSPEPWIDRKGRARGNRLALRHILSGRLDPKYISEL